MRERRAETKGKGAWCVRGGLLAFHFYGGTVPIVRGPMPGRGVTTDYGDRGTRSCALAIFEEKRGEHAETAIAMSNLAVAEMYLGDYREALTHTTGALEMRRKYNACSRAGEGGRAAVVEGGIPEGADNPEIVGRGKSGGTDGGPEDTGEAVTALQILDRVPKIF